MPSSRLGQVPKRSSALVLAAILAAATLVASTARGQIAPGDTVPTRGYFATQNLFYDGDYRNALAAFLNQSRAGIKTPTSQWIDSICYFTMAGESYYQLGNLTAALQSYNSALQLYVNYSDWMLRVQFPQAILPATVGTLRAAPWGQSKRGAVVGAFPETFMMGQGQVDNTAAFVQGGVVQRAMLFPVHAAEIVRCTSLAIRRRRDLLGPISKYDPLTSNLVDVLSRHPGPPNHWSEAWVNVQLGCAQAAAGNSAQAIETLQRAVYAGGEFVHPLTSTALVELSRLALEAGDFNAAAEYSAEATYACINFPNLGNLEEAFRLAALAHTLLNQKTPLVPLVPAIAWSKAGGYRQLQASLLLSAAENMALIGDSNQAASNLAAARLLIGRSDLGISQLGARMNHLTAVTAYQGGNVTAGDQALSAALAFQRSGGSLWMFQLGLADSRYTGGDFSDRVGLALYEILLRDPSPGDWTSNPLECLSYLSTPHSAPLEHWFELALKNSKQQELALEISDRARRHRFFSTLPMGGRLLALRWILEGPPELLGEQGLLQRQELLVHYPKYKELAQQAADARARLAAKPLVAADADARKEQSALLSTLAEISQSQETILRQIAVRREPAEMVFPPLRKTKDVQQGLPKGQVLLSFFSTSRGLYAFLYSSEKYAAWQVNSPASIQKQLTFMLREMGNFDSNHEITPNELAKTTWRTAGARILNLLFEKSNVDLAGNFDEIVIVPDGMLWYLPFEALPVGKGENEKLLISHVRVRYAPTVGLGVPFSRVHKPRPTVGVVVGKLHPQDDESVARGAFEQLSREVTGSVALPRGASGPASMVRLLLDGLIVLDDVAMADDPYEWAPAQVDRGHPGGSLEDWMLLPFGGPEQVLLPGFHTAAENGVRKSSAEGNELFLSLCGLMSSGARTILISRWRVGGQTSFDLVREFAQELPNMTPAEAWQRSVRVAGDTPLEEEHEPRVKKQKQSAAASELPKADHPFFWAGYMLVDSGALAPGQDKALAVPGLGGTKKEGAQLANPPLVPGASGVPAPPPPDAVDAADEAPKPVGKKPKKVKPAPRPSAKKPPARSKPPEPASDE